MQSIDAKISPDSPTILYYINLQNNLEKFVSIAVKLLNYHYCPVLLILTRH